MTTIPTILPACILLGLPAHLVQDAGAPNLAALSVDGVQLSQDLPWGGARRGELAHALDWGSSYLSGLGSLCSFLGSGLCSLLGSGFCSGLLLSLRSPSPSELHDVHPQGRNGNSWQKMAHMLMGAGQAASSWSMQLSAYLIRSSPQGEIL